MSEKKPKINSFRYITPQGDMETHLTFSDRFNVILGNGEAKESKFIDFMRSAQRVSEATVYVIDDGAKDICYSVWGGGNLILNVNDISAVHNILTYKRLGHDWHHERIRRVMRDELDDVQSFIYTQNATVLDHLYFESADEVQRSLILAESIRQEDGSMMPYWRDPTDKEAEGFFSSYDVGIMHVSEILKVRGMW